MEKLDYLIRYLLKECGKQDFDYLDKDKKCFYRALVNKREPNIISEEYLQVEDEYLQEELQKSTVTSREEILTIKEKYNESNLKNSDKICLFKGDITKLKVDAIVNAANSRGLGCFMPNHNCIDNQIHTFSGVRLRLECNDYMQQINYDLETSKCFITKGYNLPAKNVIHTVGPIVINNLTDELKKLLKDTYINCLECAVKNNIRSIAFPCISTGVFRFPKDEASIIAIKAVDEFMENNRDKLDKVIFNLWSNEDVMLYERNIK